MTSAASKPEIGTPGFCGTCPYFSPSVVDGARGFCQRFPPQALPGGFARPRVFETDWCGEHPTRQHPPESEARPARAIRPAPAKPRARKAA